MSFENVHPACTIARRPTRVLAFCTAELEKTFDDVIRQGEIEGLTFDKKEQKLLLLYNRGARIVLGMPRGFYEGYDREISEVFSYKILPR